MSDETCTHGWPGTGCPDCVEENDPFTTRNFGGPAAMPLTPEAEALLNALTSVLATEKQLTVAKRTVPDYTGQWSPEDYYRFELHERNKAANRLARVINHYFIPSRYPASGEEM